MTSARIITYAEAYSFLRALGIPEDAVKLADETFALPTRDWVQRFAEPFTRLVENLGASGWVEQVFDCENHALRAALWVTDCHRATYEAHAAPKAGIAFGELWIGSWGHAINFAIHELPIGSLDFQAYEPQLTGPRQIAFAPRVLTPDDFQTVQLAKLQ